MIERVGPDRWRDAKAVRLRALADSPGAFLATLEQEQALTDDEWRARLSRPDAATFLAGPGLGGTATGVRSSGVPGAVELVGMWTAPEARGTGVGRSLVDAVVRWAAEQGARLVVLDVASGNDGAAAFYERCGFVRTEDPALRAGMAVACDLRYVKRSGSDATAAQNATASSS